MAPKITPAAPLKTTMGQLLINEALPPELRNYGRVLDRPGIASLFRDIAKQRPDDYKDIGFKLLQIGRESAYRTGGMSVGLKHLRRTPLAKLEIDALRERIQEIQTNPGLSDKDKQELTLIAAGNVHKRLSDVIYKESLESGNPLGEQVLSGARGGKGNLQSLLGGDMTYVDHHDRPISMPVLKSYSQGLSPAEYWAGTYGGRKGLIDTKFATQESGALAKIMNQAVHRLVITGQDGPDGDKEPDYPRGLPVDVDDPDNEGSLLARSVGTYKRNTILTPKILQDLRNQGTTRLLIRDPTVGGPPDGGVYARDAGIREKGIIPPMGDWVGLAGSAALAEPLSQGALGSKHGGGVAGASKTVSGFKLVKQLAQIPAVFPGGAAHAQQDGRVNKIEEAPAGGSYISIGNTRHYVEPGFELKVKEGDNVEAGDVLSNGIPNPSQIVEHKGIGEGRRYFMDTMRSAFRDMGIAAHRRNIALLARGLIDHVRTTDEFGDHMPDDIVPYSALEHYYKPRAGYIESKPSKAMDMYLERPALHYSIGTKVRPSVVKQLEEFNVNNVSVHKDPPPFQPEMIRASDNLQHDPDWAARMLGQKLQTSVLDAVHRGLSSDEEGTSYVPGLMRGKDFGRIGLTKSYPAAPVLKGLNR